MLNILIPMAGRGARFEEAGFTLPKPLIPIHGKPMIRWVIESLSPRRPHRFIFVCLRSHINDYALDQHLYNWAPNSVVIPLSEVTEGAACTVLKARKWIENDYPLMIANCDQWISADINDYLALMESRQLDGLMMTMTAENPKWSFAKVGETGFVTEVAEKRVISNEATVGIYNFRHGYDFVDAADQMIARNTRTNGEFYVAPVFNELIEAGRKIGVSNTGLEGVGMHGLGVPEDVERFSRLDLQSF